MTPGKWPKPGASLEMRMGPLTAAPLPLTKTPYVAPYDETTSRTALVGSQADAVPRTTLPAYRLPGNTSFELPTGAICAAAGETHRPRMPRATRVDVRKRRTTIGGRVIARTVLMN